MKNLACAFLISIIGTFGCNTNNDLDSRKIINKIQQDKIQQDKIQQDKTEDFEEFYHKFYLSKTFQISRVDSHIIGYIKYINENDKTVREKWNVDKSFEVISFIDLKKQLNSLEKDLIKSDSLVIEKIWIPNSGLNIERKFYNRNGKWILFYYVFEYM